MYHLVLDIAFNIGGEAVMNTIRMQNAIMWKGQRVQNYVVTFLCQYHGFLAPANLYVHPHCITFILKKNPISWDVSLIKVPFQGK